MRSTIVIARVREEISPHVVLCTVESVDAMPNMITGMIMRRELRVAYWGD
ncbi:MAG: hypothetical protein AAF393_14200 [Pseudomonadota bacterium]